MRVKPRIVTAAATNVKILFTVVLPCKDGGAVSAIRRPGAQFLKKTWALEDRIAAVDDEAVAGVETRGVRGQVHGNAREILRLAPAAHRHAPDRLLIEL